MIFSQGNIESLVPETPVIQRCQNRYRGFVDSWNESIWSIIGYDATTRLWMIRVQKRAHGKKQFKTHIWVIDEDGKSYSETEITLKWVQIKKEQNIQLQEKAAYIANWSTAKISEVLAVQPGDPDYSRQMAWLR